MTDNLLTWNVTNWITITLMAVTGLFVVYFLAQTFHWSLAIFNGIPGNSGTAPNDGGPNIDPFTGTSNNA